MLNRSVLLILIAATASFGAELITDTLECEALSNPVGIQTGSPRLSWKLKSQSNRAKQTAYQILVARSRHNLTEARADQWDSGRVASSETMWIPYAGKPLRSFEQCWWKVRAWSDASPGPWSEPARWTTSIVDEKGRRGSWISTPSNALRSGPMPLFRKAFTVEKEVRSAVLLVAGLGFHEVRLNGKAVTQDVLAPAWTDYRKTVLYDAYDVTELINRGGNAIGVMLGNGFYNVVGGRYAKYTGSFGAPRLWAQLHIEFADGSSSDIGVDNSWRTHSGPVTFSDMYGGEDYDARLAPKGWDLPTFNDEGWTPAVGIEAPGGELEWHATPGIRVMEEYKPLRVTQPNPDIYVFDLGQNFAGWPAIVVSGPRGATIKLTPGELLDSNGLVSQRSSGGGPTYFSYVLSGSGWETWSPRFSYYGFRYVQVEGARPEPAARAGYPVLRELKGQALYLNLKRTGTFSSSNATLNRIHSLIDAAVRSNLYHSLTDCPHREKLGWLEQSYLMGPSLLYDWDLRTFLPKIIGDIRDAQSTSGLIPDIAPEYVTFGGGFRDSPEWGSAEVILPWFAWIYYNDQQPVRDSYAVMRAYLEYLEKTAENGLLVRGLGDWYDIAPGPPGPSKLTPPGVTGTATWYRDLNILSAAASLLGEEADAVRYRARAEEVREQFQRAFYQRDGTYATGSQTAQAMPLVVNLVSSQDRKNVLETLVKDIRGHGDHTTAGDVGYGYVIQALIGANRNDVVFDMATQTTPPSYAGLISAGATSLTEAWDANPDSSQNHLMLGHIEQWFYSGLAGIRPDPGQPGMRHVFIEPQPVGDVRSVSASWETVRGAIGVDWKLMDSSFRLSLDLPVGMTADVSIPVAPGRAVRLAGDVSLSGSGISLQRKEPGKNVYMVPAGHYEFEARQ